MKTAKQRKSRQAKSSSTFSFKDMCQLVDRVNEVFAGEHLETVILTLFALIMAAGFQSSDLMRKRICFMLRLVIGMMDVRESRPAQAVKPRSMVH
jgi:hypothetical protein